MAVHPLSLTSLPVRLFFEDTELAVGSGFLINRGENWFFATAWHNLTGRHRWTGKCLRKDGGVPNIALIGVRFVKTDQAVDERLLWVRIELYGSDGLPTWLVHPDAALNADVALIPFSITGDIPNEYTTRFVSPLEQQTSNMAFRVGSELFILGYPFGVETFPIWKRATVASEPYITTSRQTPFLSVDTATRQGLSGSPIYTYSSASYQTENGLVHFPGSPPTFHRFIGIYTGRRPSHSGDDAQIGIVWMNDVIGEIMVSGLTDRHPSSFQPVPFPEAEYELPKPSDADLPAA